MTEEECFDLAFAIECLIDEKIESSQLDPYMRSCYPSDKASKVLVEKIREIFSDD